MKIQLFDYHIGIRQFTLLEFRKEYLHWEFTLFRILTHGHSWHGPYIENSWYLFHFRWNQLHNLRTVLFDLFLFNRQFQRRTRARSKLESEDLPF